MRLYRHKIEIRNGTALLCDPLVVGHDPSNSLDDGACFKNWEGDGDFYVYTDGEAYFINIDPRILKAKSRPQLTQIPGRVGIDSAHIGIFDLTPDRMAVADDAIAGGWAVAIHGLTPGNYVTWFEEKTTAQRSYRGVIGFGQKVTMLLNGDTAEQLQVIEDRIAAAYRLKSCEKQTEFREIGEVLTQIHLDGCKDPRLRMLADAIKFKLPRRPSHRKDRTP